MIDGKKIIEIRKIGFLNMGSVLMMLSILNKIKKESSEVEFALSPSISSKSLPYLKRAELGLYQKFQLQKLGISFSFLGSLIPAKFRNMFGIILDKEIDIVIDAAGFAYSDQLGNNTCKEFANYCKKIKKNGTKIILMPQAFGPFKSLHNKKNMRIIMQCANLVFARDKISYENLVNLTDNKSKLKMSCDFTNLLDGIVPHNFDKELNKFCIAPSYRMIDKLKKVDSDAYLKLIIEATRYLYENGQKPFILIHENKKNELNLAHKIRENVNNEIKIINYSDALKTKGILSTVSGLIGSRYHSLVNAMSQDIPALGIGWSHKYKELFNDYGFPEGLLELGIKKEQLHKKIDLIIEKDQKQNVIKTIEKNGKKLKKKTQQMWDDIMKIL